MRVWHPVSKEKRAALPREWREWLLYTDSLTERLSARCSGKLHLRIQQQKWQYPVSDEARLLHIQPRQYAWIRQVYLCCGAERWVFARTVIPALTLRGSCRRLARLGKQPLGKILFTDKPAQRTHLEIGLLPPHHLLCQRVALENKPLALWGRRSVFTLKSGKLLVTEIFLPALLQGFKPDESNQSC